LVRGINQITINAEKGPISRIEQKEGSQDDADPNGRKGQPHIGK